MKEVRKTVVEPRSEYVMVRTTKQIKERLQALADKRGLSLSLIGHLAFIGALEVEDLIEEAIDDDEEEED